MCLDTIESRTPEPSGVGYKVFRINRYTEHIYSEFIPNGPLKVGKWLKASQVILHCNISNKCYKSGFHIFKNKSNIAFKLMSKKYFNSDICVIRKVKYRGATTLGQQYGLVVIVADEMKILP